MYLIFAGNTWPTLCCTTPTSCWPPRWVCRAVCDADGRKRTIYVGIFTPNAPVSLSEKQKQFPRIKRKTTMVAECAMNASFFLAEKKRHIQSYLTTKGCIHFTFHLVRAKLSYQYWLPSEGNLWADVALGKKWVWHPCSPTSPLLIPECPHDWGNPQNWGTTQ